MDKPISASVKNSLVQQLENLVVKQDSLKKSITASANTLGHLHVKSSDVVEVLDCQHDLIVVLLHILDGISE